MFGKNLIRPPEKGDGNSLDVQEIFPTLQGEGPYAGTPAIFIRLGGCNLACTFCDTEFESYTNISIHQIISEVEKLAQEKIKLVVITGGEPFRQPIEKLCDALIQNGYKVQIETNGTIFRELNTAIEIICSPKNTGSGYHPIRDDLLRRINAIKFVISATNKDYSGISEVGQSKYNIPVFLQPMDEYDPLKNRQNQDHAVKLAFLTGYRVSLQTHKILGIS